MAEYILLEDCSNQGLYRLHSRNLTFGVFNIKTNGFVGLREKLGDRFLFTEYHWDTGPPHGTAKPLEIIDECPIEDLRAGFPGKRDGRNVWMGNTELFDWLKRMGEKYLST